MRTKLFIAAIVLVSLATCGFAQEIVSAGKGSYASAPPSNAGKDADQMMSREIYVVDSPAMKDRPIPTNDWWTDLVISKFSGSLWSYPFRINPNADGLEIFYPTTWNDAGNDMIAEAPLRVGGANFKAVDARAKDWGDWTVAFRCAQSPEHFMDVTIGRGLPFVWIEFTGVAPLLKYDRDAKVREGGEGAIVVESKGRLYGVFGASGTRFARVDKDEQIDVRFAGKNHFLVIAALPDAKSLTTFRTHAFAIPRDSRFDWTYDAAAGIVHTKWTLRTEALQGKETRAIQGWLPHHYRGGKLGFETNPDISFATPRGTMKCAIGDTFAIDYRFTGFLPHLPAPQKTADAAHPFDVSRMHAFLEKAAKKTNYGDDTYWGAKDLINWARFMAAAHEMSDPTFDALRDTLRRAMVDWFTYTPGENAHYFARYPRWGALVGFKGSYGSETFTDNHFHYGYFTTCAAMLGMVDPQFLKDYGPMVRLVAKQYANWERDDKTFPFLRTFDPWAGHSWAGGFSSGNGNNQESSSEAMQSWGGLYLLGVMLNDDAMTAAGAMGYAIESRATMEYWFNESRGADVWPKQYKHDVVGMIWDGGNGYATYFSGDPAWIYGIQWLPASPMLTYLVEDQKFAKENFQSMLRDRAAKEGSATISSMGAELGNVILSHAAMVDPPWAVAQFDELWDANDKVAHEGSLSGFTYFTAHALRSLGHPARGWRMSVPTSCVYESDDDAHRRTFVAYNPKPYPQLAEVFKDDVKQGTIFLPASQTLTRTDQLQPPPKEPGVVATMPMSGAKDVSRTIDTVYVDFSEPIDAKSLQGFAVEGEQTGQVTAQISEGDARVVAIKLSGRLKPGASYRISIPTSVKTTGGKPALATKYESTFTLEPQPPLALIGSDPADGADHVPSDLHRIRLQFNAWIGPTSGAKIIGKGVTGLENSPRAAEAAEDVLLEIVGRLEPDESYEIVLPKSIKSHSGDALAKETKIAFSTAPSPCPPNVYAESFAGGVIKKDDEMSVDARNREHPHSGRFAIKLVAAANAERDATVSFLAGTSDNGDGRKPIDLSRYDKIEFWLAGDCDHVWAKIGHPVFDKNAFAQSELKGIGTTYRRFTLQIPSPKNEINTLLVISVPPGKTVYVDDIRFIAGNGGAHN